MLDSQLELKGTVQKTVHTRVVKSRRYGSGKGHQGIKCREQTQGLKPLKRSLSGDGKRATKGHKETLEVQEKNEEREIS